MNAKKFLITLAIVALIVICALYLARINKVAPLPPEGIGEVPSEQTAIIPQNEIEQNPTAETPSSSVATLREGTYALTSFNGTKVEGSYDLIITKDRLSTKFCNNMNGNYSIDNGMIKGMMVSTLMYCSSPDIVMKLENAFSTLISSGAKITTTDNTLTLSDNSNTFVYNKK